MPEGLDKPPQEWVARKQILTQCDLIEIARLMQESHNCKFPSVSHEQMDKLMRMSEFFQQVEAKVIGGIAWALIAFIGGMLYVFYNHGYFTGGNK